MILHYLFRNSCSKVFCKPAVLKNIAKFTGKHLRRSLFFNKVIGCKQFIIPFSEKLQRVCRQILLLILCKFKWINKFFFPLEIIRKAKVFWLGFLTAIPNHKSPENVIIFSKPATHRWSTKNAVLKNCKITQGSTCARVSFNCRQTACNFMKK